MVDGKTLLTTIVASAIIGGATSFFTSDITHAVNDESMKGKYTELRGDFDEFKSKTTLKFDSRAVYLEKVNNLSMRYDFIDQRLKETNEASRDGDAAIIALIHKNQEGTSKQVERFISEASETNKLLRQTLVENSGFKASTDEKIGAIQIAVEEIKRKLP